MKHCKSVASNCDCMVHYILVHMWHMTRNVNMYCTNLSIGLIVCTGQPTPRRGASKQWEDRAADMQAPVSWPMHTRVDPGGQEGHLSSLYGEGGLASSICWQTLGYQEPHMVRLFLNIYIFLFLPNKTAHSVCWQPLGYQEPHMVPSVMCCHASPC